MCGWFMSRVASVVCVRVCESLFIYVHVDFLLLPYHDQYIYMSTSIFFLSHTMINLYIIYVHVDFLLIPCHDQYIYI